MRRGIALVLVATQVLGTGTAGAQSGGGTPEVGVPYSPTLAEASPTGATADTAKQNAPTAKREQVTQRGSLSTTIPIDLPPGRSGFAPSLDLAYDSGNASIPSVLGAGFDLPLSFIERSRSGGTPQIVAPNAGGARRYSDTNDAVRFEHNGQRLVPRGGVPNEYFQEINRDFTKYTYHPQAPTFFVAVDKNGTKHYFGNVPDGDLPEAILRDDLGVLRWALVRSEDAFGNTIDYRYVASPPSIGPMAMQPELLLSTVQWGAHKPSGHKPHASAELIYEPLARRQRFDHADGHIVSDRKLSTIVVKILRPTPKEVWRYKLGYDTSPTTGRLLLTRVQKHAGALHAPPIVLAYSDSTANDWVSDAKSQLLGKQLEPNTLYDRKNKIVGTRKRGAALQGFDEFFPPIANKPYWPSEWRTEFEPLQQDLSPPGSLSGWDFLDFDGDGDFDLTYAPAFAASFGVPQPWLTYIKQGSTWTSLSTLYGKDDPYGMRSGASALVDVDLDGVVDRIALPPLLGIATFGSGSTPDSKVSKQLCNWWFGHQGGFTDPPRDRWAHLWSIATLAAVSGQIGIGGSTFDGALDSQLKTPPAQVPLIGGVPSALGFCYRTNTAANPITVDSLPNYRNGGNFGAVGGFVVQKGQIPDGSPINVQKLVSYLQRFPQTLSQPEIEVEPVSTFPTVIRKPNRVSVLNTVQAPLVDLDGDGRPELVAIKAVRSSENHFGPSVWRIHGLKPIHELDDATTSTEFTRSLEAILLTKRPSSYLLRGTTQDQTCKARATRPPSAAPPSKIRLAIRDRAARIVPSMGLNPGLQKAIVDAIDTNADSKTNLGALLDRFDHEGVPTDRLLTLVDWVSTLLDVNGDGLPDFVLAKGATCWSGVNLPTLQTDHRPGFDVYLNRGDRFETTPTNGTAYANGPFAMVRNWNSQSPLMMDGTNFLDEARFPISVLSFADLDGDGNSEAILSAQVGDRSSSTLAPTALPGDASACAPLQPDGNAARVRCVWQPSAAGWRGRKDIAQRLPPDRAAARLFFDPVKKKFVDGFQFADAQRFVDLDEDGLPEIVSLSETPDNDPRRVLRSRGKRPDLLERIDNGRGAETLVSYERARRLEVVRIPKVPWVVRTISVNPHVGGTDNTGKVESEYAYAGGRWDFEQRKSLGFEYVTETTGVVQPSGIETSKSVQERRFYQNVPATQTSAQSAMVGLLRSRVFRQIPPGLDQQEESWDYALIEGTGSLGPHRARLLKQSQRRCPTTGCTAAVPVEVTREYSDFDSYDNPRRETRTESRKLGDGFDTTHKVLIDRVYQNDEATWILGLPTSETTTEATTVLSQQTQSYDRTRVAHRETLRLAAPQCGPTAPLIEDFQWHSDGIARKEERNLDKDVPPSIRDYFYTDGLRLLPNEIADQYQRNGAKAALVTKRYYDPRFGEVVREIEPSGVERQTKRDALGRVELEWLAGQLIRSTKHDWSTVPNSITTTDYPGGVQPNVIRRTYRDGLGRERQTLSKTATGAVLSNWVAFDSLGNRAEMALPTLRTDLSFVPRAANPGPLTSFIHDGYGRLIREASPDGRTQEWRFAPGTVNHTDRKGQVRKRYVDGGDRSVAIDDPLPNARYTLSRDGLGRIVSIQDPDGLLRRFSYDSAGRLASYEAPHRAAAPRVDLYYRCTDAAGKTVVSATPDGRIIRARHDELGRLIWERDRTDRELARYTYDDQGVPFGRGRLTSVSSATGVERFEYDAHGKIAKRTWESALGNAPPFGDGRLVAETIRDQIGRVIGLKLPFDAARVVSPVSATIGYDELGHERSLRIDGRLFAEVQERTPSGRMTRGVLGNGLIERWAYSPDVERLISIELQAATGTTLSRHDVTMYDANDNPKIVGRSFGGTIEQRTYAYDSLDRVTSASWGPSGGTLTSASFGYSLSGNLISKNGLSLEYTGPDGQAVSKRGASTYAYDRDGNLTGISGQEAATFTWGERGELQAATSSDPSRTNTFAYFVDGQRAAKQTHLGWDQFFDVLELRATGQSIYHLKLGPLRVEIAMEKPTGGLRLARSEAKDRYLHLDPNGSVATASDSTGGVARLDYEPYGELRVLEGQAAAVKHRFTEKEADESGFIYFGERYLIPSLGRWSSRDPYALTNPDLIETASSQSANLFAFADNNPITKYDPDGRNAIAVALKTMWENPAARAAMVAGFITAATYIAKESIQSSTGDGLEIVLLGAIAKLETAIAATKSKSADTDPLAAVGTAGGPRAGKAFTPKGKAQIDAENAARHQGKNVCEDCGVVVVPAQKSTSGVTPSSDERARDHVYPRSKGGNGDPSNGQVLCRGCNQAKSDKIP